MSRATGDGRAKAVGGPGSLDGADGSTGAGPSGAISRFLANTIWVVAAQIVAKAAGIILFAAVARGVGKTDFGYFAFALAFTPFFLKFGADGVNAIVVRDIARDRRRTRELFRSALVLRSYLDAAAFSLVVATGFFIASDRRGYEALVVIAVALLVDDFTAIHLSVFRAFEQMRLFALVDATNRIASALLVVMVVILGGGLIAACATYVAGSVLALLVAHLLLRKRVSARRGPMSARPSSRTLLRAALPFGAAGLLAVAVFRVDMVMLQVIKGPRQVALYAAAYALFETALSLSWSMTGALLPALSRTPEPKENAAIFKVAATVLMAIYVPLAVAIPFFARWLIEAIYSSRYVAAEGVVAVLAGAALCNAVANLAQTSAIVAGRGRAIAIAGASLLCLNVGMNLFAIPSYGFRGAGVTTLITELVAAGALLLLYVRDNPLTAKYTIGVGTVLIGVVSVSLLSIGGSPRPFPVVVACAGAFAGLVVVVRELGPDEREAFTRFRRRRGTAAPALVPPGE